MFGKPRPSNLPASRPAASRTGHSVTVTMGGAAVSAGIGEHVRSSAGSAAVDVVLAFDTTGSMGTSIDAMVQAMIGFADALERRHLDWRMVTVPFGDLRIPGDTVVTSMAWVSTVPAARAQLHSMPRFSGGGNGGESSFEAVDAALEREFRRNAVRVVVLITDDRPHTLPISPARMLDRVIGADVLLYAIAAHRSDYESFALGTGGEFIDLENGRRVDRIIEILVRFADTLASRCHTVLSIGGGSPQKMLEIERGNGRP